ncbi:hypothetical protein LTR85_003118 [Meristemomyces frigidus]|nr:hypothetical protein LTR85_003118 [Meristemomyces frigidus]
MDSFMGMTNRYHSEEEYAAEEALFMSWMSPQTGIQHVGPQQGLPQHAASQHAAFQHVATQHAASQHSTSQYAAPQQALPRYAIPQRPEPHQSEPQQAHPHQAIPPPPTPRPAPLPGPANVREQLYGVFLTPESKQQDAQVVIFNYDFQGFYRWMLTDSAPRDQGMRITFGMLGNTGRCLGTPRSTIERELKQGMYWLCLAAYHWPRVFRGGTEFKWPFMPPSSRPLPGENFRPGEARTHRIEKHSRTAKDMQNVLQQCVGYGQRLSKDFVLYSEQQVQTKFGHWIARNGQIMVSEQCPEGALVERKWVGGVQGVERTRAISTRSGKLRYGVVRNRSGGTTVCAVGEDGKAVRSREWEKYMD